MKQETLQDWVYRNLVCPVDYHPVKFVDGYFRCPQQHAYPMVDGIPIMLADGKEQTHWAIQRALEFASSQEGMAQLSKDLDHQGDGIHPYVQQAVGATSGNLYRSLIGNLTRYPIPGIRLPRGQNQILLDVGCNWGRWTISAAQQGYQAIGLDPSIDAVIAARHVSRQMGVEPAFVVADGRYLPFAPDIFDYVFSFGVLQHFSEENVALSLAEIKRVLKPKGTSLVQMPNVYGLRNMYQHLRRRGRKPSAFEVRYWTPRSLKETFSQHIGETSVSVDCYFSIGIQPRDLDMLEPKHRLLVHASEALRKCSHKAGWMKYFADSLYLTSVRT